MRLDVPGGKEAAVRTWNSNPTRGSSSITLCELFEEEKQVDKPTLLRLIKLAA